MSWSERGVRFFRRVDVRLAITIAAVFTPLVAIVLLALYGFAASELLELAELEVHERVSQLESAVREPVEGRRSVALDVLTEQIERDAGGFVVRDATGRTIASGGREIAFDAGPSTAAGSSMAFAITTDADLRAGKRLDSGERLEVAIGSEHFVRERDEIRRGFWVSLGLGILLVAAASIPATWLALAPLRRATRIAEAIDIGRLDARLPSRSTYDDLDRHADAVNRLLDRIEGGFERIQHFSDDVAHELRTPINRILNEIEVSLMDTRCADESRPVLESLREAAGGLARMIDGLLLIARSEGERVADGYTRVEMKELFRIVEEMYEPICDERGIQLEVGPIDGVVLGDTALLLRAVGNLIDNAITHTPRGGTIRWCAEGDGPSGIRIEISDTGPGVPASARARIFERFVRLEGVRPAGGVGLGLAITRQLARFHGGEASLEEAPDGGACFVIRLPRP